MPLDPEVKAMLDQQAASGPPRSAMSIHDTRTFLRNMRLLAGEPPPLARVEDRSIPTPVRIYTPARESALPVLVYFHGGRFISGDLESHDGLCRILAALSGWIVVAVDYRLAPEHSFPAAVDDAFLATRWVAEHASEIGGDPGRVGVAGDSAGGNLAAVVALLARGSRGPHLVCQMLIYPMLDATCSLESHVTYGSGFGPGSDDMKRGYREYLPAGMDLKDRRISPLWAGDLAGLPPAFVLTAEYDSLRDEGERYADALARADVPVVLSRYDGAVHGFFMMGRLLHLARRANDEAARWLAGVGQ